MLSALALRALSPLVKPCQMLTNGYGGINGSQEKSIRSKILGEPVFWVQTEVHKNFCFTPWSERPAKKQQSSGGQVRPKEAGLKR